MIHNTFLVRMSSLEILAETRYWPVSVEKSELDEFIATRQELRQEDSTLADLSLIVGDNKYQGRDLDNDIAVVFVTDKTEDEGGIADRLDVALKVLKRRYNKYGLEKVCSLYERIIEPSVITRLKIALVGEGGVGKTTTLHLLMGDTPPLQYVPTIALNLETVENIRFGNYSLVLWDFAGQERFRNLWKFYFHGADVIFLVCDSTLRNVIISKDIHKLIKRDAPKVPVFALANKQDKPNAMRPEVVQKILGIPTYPMVAIDKSRRDEMLRILMTAAAQFVGVVLPDLPPSELLKFTDEATAAAVEQDMVSKDTFAEEDKDEFEEEEEYEEVYVDENGQVISASELDEYEIVEVEEEDEEITEPEDASVPIIETLEEEEEAVTIEVSEEEADTSDASPDVSREVTELVEVEASESTAVLPHDDMSELIDTHLQTPVEPTAEDDNSHKIAKSLISEALDADDIITAEIERVSKDEINMAMEAFSSDETVSPEGEIDEEARIADEALMELENILGTYEEPGRETSKESDDLDDELDALDELFAVMSEEDEDEE